MDHCWSAKVLISWPSDWWDAYLSSTDPSSTLTVSKKHPWCLPFRSKLCGADTSRHYQPLPVIKKVIDSMTYAKLVSNTTFWIIIFYYRALYVTSGKIKKTSHDVGVICKITNFFALWWLSLITECASLAYCWYSIFPPWNTIISKAVGWFVFHFRTVYVQWCCRHCKASDSILINPICLCIMSLIYDILHSSYAKKRGINVLAEIDVPGHAQSWYYSSILNLLHQHLLHLQQKEPSFKVVS